MEVFTFWSFSRLIYHCRVFGASRDHIWSRWAKVLFLKQGEDSVTVTIFEATCHEKGLIRHCSPVQTINKQFKLTRRCSLRAPFSRLGGRFVFWTTTGVALCWSPELTVPTRGHVCDSTHLFQRCHRSKFPVCAGSTFFCFCLFFEESRKSDTENLVVCQKVSRFHFRSLKKGTETDLRQHVTETHTHPKKWLLTLVTLEVKYKWNI